jgi:hypothetical protein
MRTLICLFVVTFLTLPVTAQETQPIQPASQPLASASGIGGNIPVLRDLSPISIIRLFYGKEEQLRTYLSLSQEQIDNLEKVFAELDNDAKTLQANYGGKKLTPEQLESRKKEILELQKKLATVFKETLSPEQLKSFHTVRFQILGGFDSPLANVELLQIFELTQEQVEKINELVKERQTKIAAVAEILRERPETPELAKERILQVRREGIEISKEYGKKIRELLNEKQVQQAEIWEKEAVELRNKLKPYLPSSATPPVQK